MVSLLDLPRGCIVIVLASCDAPAAICLSATSRSMRTAMDRDVLQRLSVSLLRRFLPARAFFSAPSNASYNGVEGDACKPRANAHTARRRSLVEFL